MVTFEIDIGAGPREVTIDPKRITLGFLEDLEIAQATGKWAPLISAISGLLQLTHAEAREITFEQFGHIGEAMRASMQDKAAIPNA